MVSQALDIIAKAFGACVAWVDSLLSAVQGKGVLISALLIVFITSLFLMPLRGVSTERFDAITDYRASKIYGGKYKKGSIGSKIRKSRTSKGGTFTKGSRANTDFRAKMRADR